MRSQINGGSSNEQSGCNHCKSKGYKYWPYHTEKDCWKLHPEKNKYKNKTGNADTGNAITDSYLFSLIDQANAVANEMAGNLSVDSCCTTTAVNRNSFHLLTDVREPKKGHRVQVANKAYMDVAKYGTLSFGVRDAVTNQIVTISIADVLYVPDMACTLLSVGQMTKQGFEFQFKTNDNWLLTANAEKISIKYLTQRPSLEIKSPTDSSYSLSDELMHARMCHLPVPGVNHGFCNACALGKAHDATNSRKSKEQKLLSKQQITKPGQLIHTDVAGPFPKSVGK
jgi:hypothetical protein